MCVSCACGQITVDDFSLYKDLPDQIPALLVLGTPVTGKFMTSHHGVKCVSVCLCECFVYVCVCVCVRRKYDISLVESGHL